MAHGDIVRHVEIPADDMGRATGFYGTVFGWQIEEIPDFEGYPMWQESDQEGGGGFVQRDAKYPSILTYVEVDSIDEMVGKVTEAGGEVVLEKTPITDTSWYALIKDTEGNHLGLYEGTSAP